MLNLGVTALSLPFLQLSGLCFGTMPAVIYLLHMQGLEKQAVVIWCFLYHIFTMLLSNFNPSFYLACLFCLFLIFGFLLYTVELIIYY